MPAVTHDTTQEERFNALYAQHQHMVRRRVEFVLKDNYELYDDVEQETWIKAWKSLTPEREAIYSWFATIATNTAIDALRKKYRVSNKRKQQRPPPESLDADPGAYELLEASVRDIDQFLLREEIRDLLFLVNPEHRLLCFLFISGMTYIEVSHYFHCSKKVVWMIIKQLHERSRKARAEALV
jgi:RNA polymerase sigma factor (sigma-70 family)